MYENGKTGREGLAGPSKNGEVKGTFLAIVPLGGGYYFVPPIPAGGIAEIGQQFFEPGAPKASAPPDPAVTAAPPQPGAQK